MRRELGGRYIAYQWTKVPAGTTIEGVLVELTPNKFNPQNNDFKIMSDDNQIHHLYHSGKLAKHLTEDRIGSRFEVVFEGKVPNEDPTIKAKEFNQFKIFLLDGSTNAYPAIPTGASPAVKQAVAPTSDDAFDDVFGDAFGGGKA